MLTLPLLALLVAADPSPTEIAKAVRELASPNYLEREKAMRWLWSVGAPAEPALRDALKSDDAEVVVRARNLLDKIPYGITPDSPKQFVELIATARSSGFDGWKDVVPRLLDLGPNGLALAEKLADRLGADERERVLRRRMLDGELWRITPSLIVRGEDSRVTELLERSARAGARDTDPKAVRHYAAWLALHGELGKALPVWRERAGTDDAAVIIAHQLARIASDHAVSRAMAEKSERVDLREAAYFDAGAWAELGSLPPPNTTSYPAAILGLKLMYQNLAGQPIAATIEELKKQPQETSNVFIPSRVFRGLILANRVPDAMELIASNTLPDPQLLRFELLCQQNQFAEALGMTRSAVAEHSLHRWYWDAARLRIYHQLGEKEKYKEVLEALPTSLANTVELNGVQELIEQLSSIGRTADALPFAAAALSYGGIPSVVFEKLYPKSTLAAEAWWHVLRAQNPSDSVKETVDRMPGFLDRRLNSPDGRAALTAAIATAKEHGEGDGYRWMQGLADACQLAGLHEEARNLMTEGARKLDTNGAWLKLGDLLFEQRRFAEAATAYESAWRKDERQPLAAWLMGLSEERAGNAAGKSRRELAHRIPLGDEDTRAIFAEELGKRSHFGNEVADGTRRERALALALSTPGSSRGRTLNGAQSGDWGARTDRLEAAGDAQRFLIRMTRTNAYFKKHESYLIVLHRVESNRARGFLAKGDLDAALKAADAAHALLPGFSSPAEHIVPELARLGKTAEADRIYKATADVLDTAIAAYPQSAEFRSRRAWLAARCGRDLPAAKTLAQKAVELAPTSAVYQETLAEVLFQLGDKAGSLAAMQKALELEPKSRTYMLQKARIEAGDAKAPLAEGR